MKISWFCLLLMSFNLCKENKTDTSIASIAKGGIKLRNGAGNKIIEIPIVVGGKLVRIGIKVPDKFIWDLAKIPFKVIIKLAWKLTRKSFRLITPKYLQNTIRGLIDNHKMKKKINKQQKSRFYGLKMSTRNKRSDEDIKTTETVASTRTFKDSFILFTKCYIDFMKKSPHNVKIFLKWIKEHIKYGIKCTDFGVHMMKCRTKGGLNIKINMDVWKQIPSFIKNRWTKINKKPIYQKEHI